MQTEINKPKIVIVASTEVTITAFFKNHIKFLNKKFSVIIITNYKSKKFLDFSDLNIKSIFLPINREISIFLDFYCLVKLFYILFKINPKLIFSCTPKAGLICSICAFILQIKNIHIFTGQVWVTKKFFERSVLKFFDKLIAFLSNHVMADSFSQRDFLISNNIIKNKKLVVLGNGSISGVNSKLFIPNEINRKVIRSKLNIDNNVFLILFLGRLNKDKGIYDLFNAFQIVIDKKVNANLLIVGDDEEKVKNIILKDNIKFKDKIHFESFTDSPEQYMAAADLFCLPSYREGFGMAAVEAGSCGLPVITSRIYGLTDAVEEGVTGLMHPPGDVTEISKLIISLYNNQSLCKKMGKEGRSRAINLYDYDLVSSNFFQFIDKIYQSEIFKRKKLAIVASTSLSISCFLINHVNNFSKYYDVTIITKINNEHKLHDKINKNCKLINLNFSRDINITSDLISLFYLINLIFRNKYYCVLTFTPKGGFLGMIASFLCRTKFRIHWFGGQVWVNRKGIIKNILKIFDKFIFFLSTQALTECESQKLFLQKESIVKPGYLEVLGNGSLCGVDDNIFKPSYDYKIMIRNKYSIPHDNIIVLYLGRLNQDKGLYDLSKASKFILNKYQNVNFMYVGPDEEKIKNIILKDNIKFKDKIHFESFTDSPEQYMAAADLFCLPSYREGFGMAAVEAGSCGLPVITSRIYGLTDAVEEGVTGLMHPPGDVESLKNCIELLVCNKDKRIFLGQNAVIRNKKLFSNLLIESHFLNFLKNKLR